MSGTVKVVPKRLFTLSTAKPAYSEFVLQPDTYDVAEVTATTTGWLWLDYCVEATGNNDYAGIYFCEEYDDSSDEIEYYDDMSGMIGNGEEFLDAACIYAVKGKTFYIYMETPDTNKTDQIVKIRAKMFSNAQNRLLPAYTNASKYMLVSGLNKTGEATSDIYIKVKPAKTGLMTVNLKCYGNSAAGYPSTGAVTLYNSNKTRISDAGIWYDSSKVNQKIYFGVAAGKTYYLRVQECTGYPEYNFKYGIRYNVTAYKDRNLPTNAKALKLIKGAKATNTLFTANNSAGTDTYKIYVPKTQVAKFTVNTQKIRSGSITVKVYKNGKFLGKQMIGADQGGKVIKIIHGTKAGKASKGTYHIKVSKGAKVSGLYTIKYNN